MSDPKSDTPRTDTAADFAERELNEAERINEYPKDQPELLQYVSAIKEVDQWRSIAEKLSERLKHALRNYGLGFSTTDQASYEEALTEYNKLKRSAPPATTSKPSNRKATDMTPKISIDEQVEAFKAWKRGEAVQWWCIDEWLLLNSMSAICCGTIIRRNPAPKLRPWRPEEVPIPCAVRRKCYAASGQVFHWLVTFVGVGGIQLGNPSAENREASDFQKLADKFEHSTDGGKTWKPCGVEEAS